jgi:ketosteroid isomerase-like protein
MQLDNKTLYMKKILLVVSLTALSAFSFGQTIKIDEPEFSGIVVYVNDSVGTGLKLEQVGLTRTKSNGSAFAETQEDYKKALELFKLQIQCIIDDDRETQMGIYSEDLHYEFPFANDRPKIIEGRDAIKKVMQPIWERRRKNNVQLSLDKYEFHATDEPSLFLAVFVFKAVIDKKSEPILSDYIQLIRIKDKHIIEVREYFKP